MIRRITTFSLPIILVLFLTLSAFALTKEERAWKEDILTLLSLVKRVGDYSDVVDLIEVVPALKEDPEIKKAFVTFAPPGATPPEWAREEITPPTITKVPEKIAIAETRIDANKKEKRELTRIKEKEKREREPRKVASQQRDRQVSEEEQKMRETEKQRREEERTREEEARRIAQEVATQKKIREREVAPPEKTATLPVGRQELTRIEEEIGVRPTPLPKEAKVIRSTDVVSGVETEIIEGKMRVTITLSGERKYTVSERTRPPSIIINIPHTINAVSPGRIMVNRGCLRMIEVTQYRSTPFDEARITVILNRETEYRVTHKNNEIYIDFEE